MILVQRKRPALRGALNTSKLNNKLNCMLENTGIAYFSDFGLGPQATTKRLHSVAEICQAYGSVIVRSY